MNGRIATAAAALLFAGVLVGASLGAKDAARNTQTHTQYPRAGHVTALDRDADVVTWTDAAGLDWSFYGVEDWMIGDTVAAIMDDMGTQCVTDDEIVAVRFAG